MLSFSKCSSSSIVTMAEAAGSSADGAPIGWECAFVLRYSAFLAKLLEACPEEHLVVTETAEEFLLVVPR